jgi:serine/threonine-protein kinase
MGVVYRAQDTVLEREVALKLLWEDFCDDESALARFQREARAVARLTHRNIVTLYELAQQEDGRPYIAMEFLRGAPLDKRLRSEPPLTLVQKIDIVAQLCAGLHFAHEQGVVHRDVKPANIWVLPDGTVKLLDFGIARLASSSITRDGNLLGTASYMAPEQIEGGAVDGRTDIFAAGVVLYELLVGHKPFEADSPTGVIAKIIRGDRAPLDPERDHLPPALVAAVDRALARVPGDRYPTASELGATLSQIRNAVDRQASAPFDHTMMVPSLPGAGDSTPDLAIGRRAGNFTGHDLTLNPPPAGGTDVDAPTMLTPPLGTSVPGAAPSPPLPVAPPRRAVPWMAMLAGVVVLVGAVAAGVYGLRGGGRAVGTGDTAPVDSGGGATAAGAARATAAPAATPAPAATAVPAARVLLIESDPAGAAVSVGGRQLPGETPLTLTLEAGAPLPSELVVEKRGYDAARVAVTEAAVAAGRLAVPLQPAVVRVRVTTAGPYPFEVVDGTRIVSPLAEAHTLTLPEGRQLRLRAPDVFLDQRVVVRGGSSGAMRIAVPGLGSISVRAVVENCSMRIDGIRADPPPVHQKPLVAGDHTVELMCADGEVRRQRVEVRDGVNTTVLFRQ